MKKILSLLLIIFFFSLNTIQAQFNDDIYMNGSSNTQQEDKNVQPNSSQNEQNKSNSYDNYSNASSNYQSNQSQNFDDDEYIDFDDDEYYYASLLHTPHDID